MNIDFLNPVLLACKKVLTNRAELELQIGKPYNRDPLDPVSGRCITGLITMHGGNRRASLAIIFSETVLIAIAAKMLPEKTTSLDSVAIDLVGELSSMILGNVKGLLEDEGYQFEMSFPTMIVGYDYIITHHTKSPIFRIPYASPSGAFHVEVSFEGPNLSDKEIKAGAICKKAKEGKGQSDIELF